MSTGPPFDAGKAEHKANGARGGNPPADGVALPPPTPSDSPASPGGARYGLGLDPEAVSIGACGSVARAVPP